MLLQRRTGSTRNRPLHDSSLHRGPQKRPAVAHPEAIYHLSRYRPSLATFKISKHHNEERPMKLSPRLTALINRYRLCFNPHTRRRPHLQLHPHQPARIFQAPLLTDREILYRTSDGPQWIDQTHWLNHWTPLNDWHGITINDDGHIAAIDLHYNRLIGPIPPELAQFYDPLPRPCAVELRADLAPQLQRPPHVRPFGRFPSRFSGPSSQGYKMHFPATADDPASFSPGLHDVLFNYGRCTPRPERGLKSGCSLFPVGRALPRLRLRVSVPSRLLTK